MPRYKNLLAIIALLLLTTLATQAAVKPKLDRVEPPNWWVGMKDPHLQLMVHGQNISDTKVKIDYPGVRVEGVTSVENPNYLFIDLMLADTVKAGAFDILFTQKGKTIQKYTYQLEARKKGSAQRKGFSDSDVIYLIMPDRFANGNPSNDSMDGMLEKADRSDPNGRHGGDIQGVIDHLGYIANQGYTQIWLNPVLENNQPKYSYHGYSTTDFYKVDPRMGTNKEYSELSAKAKAKGIGLIMDMVFNHIGSSHWWMKDMPMKDWLNGYPNFELCNFQKTVAQDPHVSKEDYNQMYDGWFVPSMPDLNQKNPYVANYLIENSIWWIEYAGLSGIRMDTYSFPDMHMMARWTCRIMKEYPNFNIVGEEWDTSPAIVSYWQRGKKNPNGYKSCLPSLMDFPIQDALTKSLTGNSWMPLYGTLAMDFLYPDPDNLVVFADNHDTERFFSSIGKDLGKFKLGMAYILTTRGIPQIYYGTEILSTGGANGEGDGFKRKDFPGGWAGDKVNAFTGQGLTAQQKTAQEFIKKLLNWRKSNDIVEHGKLMHFIPHDNIYVYFRYNDKGTIMVILNKNTEGKLLSTARFAEIMKGFTSGHDVVSGENITDLSTITVPAMSPMIIELKK